MLLRDRPIPAITAGRRKILFAIGPLRAVATAKDNLIGRVGQFARCWGAKFAYLIRFWDPSVRVGQKTKLKSAAFTKVLREKLDENHFAQLFFICFRIVSEPLSSPAALSAIFFEYQTSDMPGRLFCSFRYSFCQARCIASVLFLRTSRPT